ncbi:MAG: BMP family ABC transporter substrate-binding protein [Acidipropionibacterium jensenii]|nr:BMP family ABC transporter substrate-binding protein [Acidipropionibacterium jensenii]MDN6426388.1 BMP family ABC transporter substrate-binding protein [Acidipropionibacterium jensenii]
MKKKALAASAVFSAMALTLSACAQAPDQSSSSASPAASASGKPASGDFKACIVSDSAGFTDKSFNQTSLAGLEKAATDLKINTAKVESKDDKDYAVNIQSMVDAKCTIIVSVGFLLEKATVAAAKANPNIDFAIVDSQPEGAPSNLKPLIFNTAESSFMAGYLAAALTKTGKVGTFGGMKIPTVTIFMDGYAQGVDYYNTQKKKSVQVLGWDAKKQDGLFVPQPNPFQNVAGGKTTAQTLINQGADIVLPVAGNAGNGALQVVKSSGGKANAIWVDADGCNTQPNYCSSIITSVYKGMDVAVYDAIKAAKDGSFSGTPYVGSLADGGTGLSPFHTFDSKIPADLKADLTKIKSDIGSGAIKITSTAQPKKCPGTATSPQSTGRPRRRGGAGR